MTILLILIAIAAAAFLFLGRPVFEAGRIDRARVRLDAAWERAKSLL